MPKLTIGQLDLAGKRVFLRADLNAPLKDGVVADDTRLAAIVPTVELAWERGASLVLASHLGRPKGGPAPEFSLRPVAERLESLLRRPVPLAPDCVGPEVSTRAGALQAGEVLLLENLRFHREEEANDDGFAQRLAGLADCYVNDAFREAAAGRLRGILDVTDEELVSCDFNGNPHSSIIDLPSTAVVDGGLVKVLAWYDNEWGYSCRLRDLIRFMAKSL